MTASAGLFDNLADVADGALAAYGHTDGHRDRRDLTSAEIDNALREALALSAGYAGQQMARSGHYANGKGLMIPLPLKWREARKVAQRIGYSGDFDSLHQQVNTAAIESVPALIKLIDNEVDALAFTNPVELLHSSEKTAASEYLRKYSDASLRTYLRPVVKRALVRSGASATGLKIATRVGSLPMVRNLPLDLTDHVVDATIENFFRQLGLQETAIRTDPRRRTSGLLKKVFG
jgi:hypothetical protein